MSNSARAPFLILDCHFSINILDPVSLFPEQLFPTHFLLIKYAHPSFSRVSELHSTSLWSVLTMSLAKPVFGMTSKSTSKTSSMNECMKEKRQLGSITLRTYWSWSY